MLESKPTIQQISSDTIQLDKQIYASERATIFHGTWYGHDIAVKRFDKTKQRGNFEQSFQKTMEAMGKYRFPTIINYYGVFLNANDYAIVMEWMPKGSLNDVLHNPSETFAWNPVRWQIAIDTAEGLSYLHGQGGVHGDLSSFSIMLDMNYRAKLTLNSKEGLGAVRWRAPELFKRGATTNPVSEIYSFGMVLWEITTRLKPYASDEDDADVSSYIKDNEKETVPETSPKTFADSINACWDEIGKRPVASQLLQWLSEAKPPVEMPPVKMIEPTVESKSVSTSAPAVVATEKSQNNVSPNPIPKTVTPCLNPQQTAYVERLLPMLLKAFISKETVMRNMAKDELIHIKNLIPESLMFNVIDTLLNAMTDENNGIIETVAQVLGEFADNINLLQTSYIEKLLPTLLKALTSKETVMRNTATDGLIHIKNLIPEPLMSDVIDTLLNAITDENNSIAETAVQVLGKFADSIPKSIQAKALRVIINTMTTKHQTNRLEYYDSTPRYNYYDDLRYDQYSRGINDKILENLALIVAKLKGTISDDYKSLVATTILTCMPKETEKKHYLEKIWPNSADLIDFLLQLIANKDSNSLLAMDILTSFKDYAQFFVAELDVFSYLTPGFHLYRKVDPNTNAEETFAYVVYGVSGWDKDASGQMIYHYLDVQKEILNLSQLAAEKSSLALLEGLHPVQEPSETYFNEGLVELIKSNCDPKQLQDRSSLRKKSHDIIPVLLAALTTGEFQVRERVAKTLCDLKEIIPAGRSVEIIQLLVNEENFFVDEAMILQQYFRNLPEIRAMALERSIVQLAHSAISAFKLERTEKTSHEIFKKYISVLIRFKAWIPEAQYIKIIDTLVLTLKNSDFFDESICEAIIGLKEYIPASFTSVLFNTLIDIIKSRQYKNLQHISMLIAKLQNLIPEMIKPTVIDIDILLSAINTENEDTQQDAIKSLGILIDFMTVEQRTLLVDELLNKIKTMLERDTCGEGASLVSSIYKTLGQCYGFISDELGLKIVEGLMERLYYNYRVNELTADCYAIETLVKFKMIMPDNLKKDLFVELSERKTESTDTVNPKQRDYYLATMIELSTELSQNQKLATKIKLVRDFNYLHSNKYYWEALLILNMLAKLEDQSKANVEINIAWKFLERTFTNLNYCRIGLNKEAFRSSINYVITSLIAVMQKKSYEDDEVSTILSFFRAESVFEEAGNLLSDTQKTSLIALLMDKIKTTYDIQNIKFLEMLLTLKKLFSEKDKDTLWEYLVTIKLHTTDDSILPDYLLTLFADASKVFSEIKRHAMIQFLFSQTKQKKYFHASLTKWLMQSEDFLSDTEKKQLANILAENFQTNITANLHTAEGLSCLSVDIIAIVLKPVLRALENPDYSVRSTAIGVLRAFHKKIPTESHRQIIENLLIALMDENPAVRDQAVYTLAQFKDLVPADMYAQLQSGIEKNWPALNQGTKLITIKMLMALNLSSPGLIKSFCEMSTSAKEVPAEVKEALAHFGINDSQTLESLHRDMMSSDSNAAVHLLGYVTIPLPELVIADLFKTLGKYPSASFALGRASRYQPEIIDKLFEKLNEKDIKPEVTAIILQALTIGLQAMVVVVQDKQDNQAHGNNRNLLLAQPTPSLNPEHPSLSSALEMRMNK